jgi:hypothetical protein
MYGWAFQPLPWYVQLIGGGTTYEAAVTIAVDVEYALANTVDFADTLIYAASLGYSTDTPGSDYNPSVQIDTDVDFLLSENADHIVDITLPVDVDYANVGGGDFSDSISLSITLDISVDVLTDYQVSVDIPTDVDFQTETASDFGVSIQLDTTLGFETSNDLVPVGGILNGNWWRRRRRI